MSNRKTIGSLMLLLAALIWGFSYSTQSIMSSSLNTFAIIFVKTLGGILLLAYCFLRKKKFTKKVILIGTVVGVINGLGLILQQIGIVTSSVSNASFISGLYAVFVPIIGLFTKKKPKKKFWLAVLIALVGMYLLCMNGNETIKSGDLITLVAAFCFALQVIFIDKYAEELDPVVFCGFQQVTVAVISGVLMFVIEKPQLSDFNGMLLPLLYTMLGSGLLGQVLQNKYQSHVDPTVASLIMSLESVFGALGGWLLLNQTLSFKEIIGCVLIFVSIVIAE